MGCEAPFKRVGCVAPLGLCRLMWCIYCTTIATTHELELTAADDIDDNDHSDNDDNDHMMTMIMH